MIDIQKTRQNALYRHNQNKLIEKLYLFNKNDLKETIGNFAVKNTEIIQEWFNLDTEKSNQWLNILNNVLILNKKTFSPPTQDIKIADNFYGRLCYASRYYGNKQTILNLLDRYNLAGDWQDYIVITNLSLNQIVKNAISKFLEELKTKKIIDLLDMKQKYLTLNAEEFEKKKEYKSKVYALFQKSKNENCIENEKRTSLITDIYKLKLASKNILN